MADFILTTTDQAIFDPEVGLATVTLPPLPPTLEGSGNGTIDGKTICVEGDEKKIIVLCEYIKPPHMIPGNGELSIKLALNQIAMRTKSKGRPVLLKGDTFVAEFRVMLPAEEPGEPPIPDPIREYSGTGTFKTDNFTTKAT